MAKNELGINCNSHLGIFPAYANTGRIMHLKNDIIKWFKRNWRILLVIAIILFLFSRVKF